MNYKEIKRLVDMARANGGYVTGGPADDRTVSIGEKTGKTLENGRAEYVHHDLHGVDAFDFVQGMCRSYVEDLNRLWDEIRAADLEQPGLTLLQHVHSLVRSTDPEIARSQLIQDELLDHVTIGSGEMEQAAEELRKIADKLDETSDKMDDMPVAHGSTREL